MSVLAYFATRRIGRTVTRLNRFAEKAERGSVYGYRGLPHDELGSISTHIIRLYARLQRTMEERDSEHRRAMYEQEEKNRIKKQLTNNINHELKTPVASIKVCLETILDHRDLPARKHWSLSSCATPLQRLTGLLNDVAAITRMDDGAANIAKEPVDIGELVEEIAHSLSGQLQKSGMSLSVDIPAGSVVEGNRAFLCSIFRKSDRQCDSLQREGAR